MRGMVLVLTCATALPGCDVILRLDDIHVAQPGPTTLVGGDASACWIRPNRTLWCWGRNDDGELGLGGNATEFFVPTQVGDATWQAVSAAGHHTCGIQTDHTLWCWGSNQYGQLGTGDLVGVAFPVQEIGTWAQVSAGTQHTCAIDRHGGLSCWGDNENGEIGVGTVGGTILTPTAIGSGFTAVAAGSYFTCAIRSDASLWCWGHNGDGQLGDGDFTDVNAPVAATSTEHWVQIAAGSAFACGLTVEGRLRCWGASFSGETGAPSLDDVVMPSPILIGGVDRNDWVAVATNARHVCAWNHAHEAYCFGDSSRGELGLDGDGYVSTPTQIPGDWTAFALGTHVACGLDPTNVVSCAGANGWGQLGNGTDTVQIAPVDIGPPQWLRVHAAAAATCVQHDDTAATNWWCAGDNTFAQLGLGTRVSQQTLTALPRAWDNVYPGETHTCGADANHALWCWGGNDDGRLGIGTVSDLSAAPMQVGGLSVPLNNVSVRDHTCVVDSGYNLRCWGPNAYGQANPATAPANVTQPSPAIGSPAQWDAVDSGDTGYTCAVHALVSGASSLNVFCVGYNADGELGDGSTTNRLSLGKVRIGMGQDLTLGTGGPNGGPPLVAAGATHACVLDSGSTYCWGWLHDGNQVTARQVPTATPFQELAVGRRHTCGIRTDHTLACWGDNSRGQLGTNDPTRTGSSTPVDVGGGNWQHVAAGDYHTCALRGNSNNFQLSCWGSDDDGALGDGKAWTTTFVPVLAP